MRPEEIIAKELEAIEKIPLNNPFKEVVDLIEDHVHPGHDLGKRGKIVLSGIGKAGHIAFNIAMTLSSTGTPAVFLHPTEAQHGDLGMIQPADVLIVVSNSGETREVIELMDLTRNLFPGIPFVAITGNKKSTIAEKARFVLDTGSPEEIGPLGLTPTSSTTTMTVIGDIVVIQTMERINFTKEEYAKRHHGGYLGQKANQ
jgi:arabinose-5-phosphate isomerase